MKNLSRELKLLAISEQIPIVAISSATPDDITDMNSVPTLGQTSWSRQIAYDADWLLALGRAPNSDVFKAVQAIQEFCEIHEVGCTSDSYILTVLVRDSSIPYDAGDTFQNAGNTITKLQTAVRAALDGAAVTVKIGRIKDDDTEV
jgi:hypothetical protein